MKEFIKENSIWIIIALLCVIIGLDVYFTLKLNERERKIDEIEYKDSANTYHKQYYESKFKQLKKTNKELYDSLKQYKDEIDFLVQFTHEKEYNSGKVHGNKPNVKDSIVYDTVPIVIEKVARTYEYTSEPNDTFEYRLNVNSFTEPLWYSLDAKVKNKFTIVNKDEGNGINHITIQPSNGGTVSNATVYKKERKNGFWKRFAVGPSVTAGYDIVNKQWGITAGASVTFDLTKQ